MLRQYVNTKPSEEVKFAVTIITSLTTYAASIPAHSWSFSGEAVSFRTEFEFYPGLQFSVRIFSLSLPFIPGLQFAVCVSHWRWTKLYNFKFGAFQNKKYVLWSFQWKRSVWKSSKQVRTKTVLIFSLRPPYHNFSITTVHDLVYEIQVVLAICSAGFRSFLEGLESVVW